MTSVCQSCWLPFISCLPSSVLEVGFWSLSSVRVHFSTDIYDTLPRQQWSLLNRPLTAQLDNCGVYKDMTSSTSRRDPDDVSRCRLMPCDSGSSGLHSADMMMQSSGQKTLEGEPAYNRSRWDALVVTSVALQRLINRLIILVVISYGLGSVSGVMKCCLCAWRNGVLFSLWRNCSCDMAGSWNDAGRKFQLTDQGTAKLQGPEVDVVVCGTNRSPWAA